MMDSVYQPLASPRESYPLNVDDLLSRCLGRLDLAERLVRKFQSSLDADLQKLAEAIQIGDATEVAHLAHRIKGASLAVSADQVTECARCLEESAMAGRSQDLLHEFDRLKSASSRFKDLPALTLPAGNSA